MMAYAFALSLFILIVATSVNSSTIHFSFRDETPIKVAAYRDDNDIGVKTKLEEKLLEMMEEFRGKMGLPQPDMHLPALEPFAINDYKVNVNRTDQIKMTGDVTNALLKGLSSFEILRLKLYIVQAKAVFQLAIPKLEITTNYDLKGSLSMIEIPVYGKGNATLSLHNVTLEAMPQFHIVDKHLAVSKLNLDWNPAAWFQVNVDGLYCTSSELSSVVGHIFSDLTPRILRNYKPIILSYSDDYLFKTINLFLSKLSLKDIIDLIPHK